MRQAVNVLGPLELIRDGATLPLRPAQRRLLAALLIGDPPRVVRSDTLMDRLWGEDQPTTARAALHVHVAALRRYAPGLVSTARGGYRVELAGYRYDRTTFERLAARASDAGRRGEWEGVLGASAAALRLWRGEPFQELDDGRTPDPEVVRLTELRDVLSDLRARAVAASGRHAEAITALRELTARHPLREPLWEELMLALYRAGRPAEALRAFQEVRRILAVELDVEPARALQELHDRVLSGDDEVGPSRMPTSLHNLPPSRTSFLGRDHDLDCLADLLEQDRLVTIVGGPGFGKTRLAVEAARAAADRFRDGVWFVSLAETRSPVEVISAISGGMGLQRPAVGAQAVAQRLTRRSALLILDNCEHVVESVITFAGHVMAAGGELRLLLTSRRPLGIPGERTWRVDPLAPPDGEVQVDGSALPASASPAVRLFIDRARAVDAGFRLTERSAQAAAELCRRASGIPLVLELAARWVHALGLDDIGEMLISEPPGAVPSELGHHRSLTAALEWSMALLPPEDRRLFARCSIFGGRFRLDDVRAVCAPDQDTRQLAHAVSRLAEASLIAVDRQPDGSAHYRMLAPIREFGREQLGSDDEWTATRWRFTGHYLGKTYGPAADPLQQVVDLEQIDTDLDNLRQAFDHGLGLGRADEVGRQLVALDGYMLNRYLVAERRSWLERTLPLVRDPLAKAHVLRSLGSAAQILSDLDASLQYFHQALPVFRRHGDRTGLAQCLLSLSGLLSLRGDWRRGIASAEEARQLTAELDSTSGLAVAAYYVGENLAASGAVAAALPELEESSRLFVAAGEIGRAAYALSTATSFAVLAGDSVAARQIAPRALELADRSGSTYRRVRALGASAMVEARYGDDDAARTMLLEVEASMEPYEMDDIFMFLLPAGLLLSRWGRRALLDELLREAEEAIERSGIGYPRPWREMVDSLKEDAAETGDGRAARPLREPDAILAELRHELAQKGA